MVTPTQRRELAAWGTLAYQVPERKVCSAFGLCRSSIRYTSRRPSQEPLRQRLRELAAARVYAGYQQLHVYLRREGWEVNHKRIWRLYREEGLSLRRYKPRRRRAAAKRVGRAAPETANELWAMDFMYDTLADGSTFRVFTAVDVHTRECVALVSARSFSGADVSEIMSTAGREEDRYPPGSRSTTGVNSRRGPSMPGPTGTGSSWTFHARANRETIRTSRPSTASFGESASRNIGFKASRRQTGSSPRGAQSTTTCGPTGVWASNNRSRNEARKSQT